MVSKRTEELLSWGRENILYPNCSVGQNVGVVFEKGYGVILQDTEGKEYIDAGSQLVNVNLGHSRKEIIDAVVEQINKLQYTSLFYGYSNTANIDCSRKLAEITPEGLDHFMFTSGGSESTESAFRIARLYWSNKGKNNYKIISLYNGYHGVSFGALSATGMERLWTGLEPLLPGFIHIPSYYCYRCAFGQEYPDCNIQCARFLAETIDKEGAQSVAAFVAEPVQGVGGSIAPPPEYWPMVRKICTEYDVLLIGDEVMTGFGRTGKLFGLQNWDVKPDMMTLAKGITSGYLPFGAVAINDKIFEGIKGPLFMPLFTYSGHPVCSAAAVKAMEIYIKEELAEKAAELGQYALERFDAEFRPLHHVGTIHGLGLLLSIEIVRDKATKSMVNVVDQVRKQGLETGLIIRVCGGNKIQFAPPLVITKEQLDRALDILYTIVATIELS